MIIGSQENEKLNKDSDTLTICTATINGIGLCSKAKMTISRQRFNRWLFRMVSLRMSVIHCKDETILVSGLSLSTSTITRSKGRCRYDKVQRLSA